MGRSAGAQGAAPEACGLPASDFAAIVAQAPDPLLVLDGDGGIRYVNAAFRAATGLADADVVGRGLDAVLQIGDGDGPAALAERTAGGAAWRGRARVERHGGTAMLADVAIAPVGEPASPDCRFLAVIRDVGERLQQQASDLQAGKLQAIGRLASGIAHEINTPTQYVSDNTAFLGESFGELLELITALHGFAEAARGGEATPERVAELDAALAKADLEYLEEEIPRALEQSREGLDRVKNIVRSMKEFAHPGSDEKSPVDLNHAIRSTVTVARNEWKYVAELETELDPELPPVPCFSDAINQVVLNIIVNASHAIRDVVGDSGAKGRIVVSTGTREGWAELRIADSGGGIPEAVRSRIFEPFFTTKGVGRGTGQGLALAHSVITDKHQGELTFETEMGKGTTFIIRLPLQPEADPQDG